MSIVRRLILGSILGVAAAALAACASTPLTPEEVAAESAAFMSRNSLRAGVVTTRSGLQYRVVRPGAGDAPRPRPEDVVIVHYEGRFPNEGRFNGAVFDSSYEGGAPAEFPLNAVIAGWTEGVGLMRLGEEFQLFIPAALAYGARGAGSDIPPNQALVFKVELLGIRRADGTEVRAPGR